MMKKIKMAFVLIALTAISTGLKSQVQTVNEGFEIWPPENWSTYILGAGNGWIQDWQGIHYEGNYSALTAINNSQCNSWLVSPQVQITSDNYELNFWEYNLSPEFFDRTAIHVSTGNVDPELGDYEEIYFTEEVLDGWVERTIDLSAYAGQNIYIGFQHEGTWHAWLIDQVVISPADFTDIALEEVINPSGVSNSTSTEEVIVKLRNYGTNVVDDLMIEWSVNGESQAPYSVNSLDLEGGSEVELTIGNFNFDESGFYSIEAEVQLAGDEITDNNFISQLYEISSFKDARLKRVKPEGMYATPGSQEVWVQIENLGQNLIDTLQVYWDINGEEQEVFLTNTLGLQPGEEDLILVGAYTFESGLNELNVEINALGDINNQNNSYLSYLAIDTIWESFEGYEFPPNNWSIEFGVLDNVNFGNPRHGIYYYSSSPDENFFGVVSDTIYTPYLDIEEGDLFTINIQTSGFLDANHQLVAKDLEGNLSVLQEITASPNSWVELDLDISEAVGIKKIGITSSVEDGPGLTRFDLFTSTASLHQFDDDLKITEGDMDILARLDTEQNFSCTIKNESANLIVGSSYTVNLIDIDGNVLSSAPGQLIQPNQEVIFELGYTFNELGAYELQYEIEIDSDENLSNNRSLSSLVHVIPATAVISEIGSQDFLSANLPFNGNGNTNSLGQDDISQTVYTADQLNTAGMVYGFTYSFNNILNVDEPKGLPLQVWAKQIESDNLADGFVPTAELTLVYDDILYFKPGLRDIYVPFNEPLALNGIDNLLIQNFQYDPAWPPAIVNFWNTDMPNDGTVRSVAILDGYQISPDQEFEFYASLKDIPYANFVIDPIIDFGVISGQVLSASDNTPLEGVEIFVLNSSLTATTDENGFYALPELPYGTYELEALLLGYDEELIEIDLNEPEFTQDFLLDPLVPIQISGTVFGSNNLQSGLNNVAVSLTGYSNDLIEAEEDGSFILSDVFSSSEYSLEFSRYGYESFVLNLSTEEEDIDLGQVILTQLFVPPFHVEALPEAEGVSVSWSNPQESEIVRYQNDLDVCAFSYTNEPNENVWLGNIFSVSEITTITDLEFQTDIYENAVDFITLEVLDMDGNVLSASDPFLVYADSVFIVDIPNIVVYDDVFVAVHWQDNPISTNALCIDYSDENIPNTAAILYPGQDIVLLSEFFGEGTPNLSFLVRMHTLSSGPNSSNGEQLTYNIYRGLSSEFPNIDSWQILNDSPVSDLSIFDTDWEGFDPMQQYRYAVETIYNEGFSEVTFSNSINGIPLSVTDTHYDLSLEMYPNPAQDFITIHIESDFADNMDLEIFNSRGVSVYHKNTNSIGQNLVVNTSDFGSGIYLVRFDFNGFILTKKLIVSE